ncbi:hypothetical protein [Nocardia sp. NPDC050406]|uniref:hypothetical protein n=1 Tax=Nocardia sp. NPDC050406 TaxID=3364318 RepID=UPI0037877C63
MSDPQPVPLLNGQLLTCDTCGHTTFEQRQWKLQTTGMTAMGMDWANRDATCYVCWACRRIHWFYI